MEEVLNNNIESYLNRDLIIQIVNEIKNDFHKAPLFYVPDSIKYLESESLINNVLNKINAFYSPSCGYSFKIPYDTISNRNSISLQIEDLAIRYLLKQILFKISGFKLLSRIETDKLIESFISKAGTKANIFKVDIKNYYESISHINFLNTISDEYRISKDSLIIKLLESSLKIVFKDSNGEIRRKEKGLAIGLKTDEYFAELYIHLITKKIIKTIDSNVINIADELLFFAENLKELRILNKRIENEINTHGLEINRSKNYSIYTHIPEIQNHKELTLKDKKEEIKITSSFQLALIYRIDDEANNTSLSDSKNVIISRDNSTIDDTLIESYEDSVQFLKIASGTKKRIGYYRQKHPNYRYFYNIVYSQPKDFLVDFQNLDLSIYEIENINKLMKIIYLFPKSEYYSFIAIDLLVFIATESAHCSNVHCETQFDLPAITKKVTKACEYANIAITEMLESENIHDYQKYLLLRRLYKNKNDLEFAYENYSIKQVTYVGFSYGDTPILPFMGMVKSQIKKLNAKTNNYALKTITNHLIEINKKNTEQNIKG